MAKKKTTPQAPANGGSGNPPKAAERAKCPTCGRALPKPKSIDLAKVAEMKAKHDARVAKLKAQLEKAEKRSEILDAQEALGQEQSD